MAGARTKGEKRRAKHRSREMALAAEGVGAPERKRGRPPKEGVVRTESGRISRAGQYQARPVPPEKAAAARRVVADARCQLMGWAIPDDVIAAAAMRSMALAPHLGCNAGRALHDLPDADRAALWGELARVRQTYARYWAVHGLPVPFPQSVAMAMLPEAAGSDGVEIGGHPGDGAGYDDRSVEERSRCATSAMMEIEGVLMSVGAVSVKGAILRDEAVKDRALLVRALLAVERVMKEGKMKSG